MFDLEERRIDHYLGLWARWMRHRTDLGYPHAAAGFETDWRVNDWEDLTGQADGYAARTVDGIVQSLVNPGPAAVSTVWLGVRWRYPDEPLESAYQAALPKVLAGLDRWGLPAVILGFFPWLAEFALQIV